MAANLEQKVRSILAERFSTSDLNLETDADDGRVSGFIISDKFSAMDFEERQRAVWGLLRGKITLKEKSQIIGFITLTPDEHSAYGEYEEQP